MTEHILVILGSGLGRVVHAMGAAGALRKFHAAARIAAVTSSDAAAFARAMPFFDDVIVDDTAPLWRVTRIRDLRGRLRAQSFARVYDFGEAARSRLLCRLIHGWRVAPEDLPPTLWSSAAGDGRHFIARITQQLHAVGISDVPGPDLGWVARTVTSYSAPFKMTEPFALICAEPGSGGDMNRELIIAAARWYAARGLSPVLVGLSANPELADEVRLAVPQTRDITGRAPAGDLVFLAWGAHSAVGPHSGITTLIATAGCKTVILSGAGSDLVVDGPRGVHVATLQRDSISGITFTEVAQLLEGLTSSPGGPGRVS